MIKFHAILIPEKMYTDNVMLNSEAGTGVNRDS